MHRLPIQLIWINLILFIVFGTQAQQTEIFNEYKQILPRGKIAAIFEPEYVSADEAEISDSAWVLGVVISGNTMAYSLNLLNHHEVVNDRVDTIAFATVW